MRKFIIYIYLILSSLVAMSQPWKNHSVLSSGIWFQLSIRETGMYKLTTTVIPELDGVSIAHIALYGNGGQVMDLDNRTREVDDLLPCAFKVWDNNGNGIFDANDYLMFYAEGPMVWRYDYALESYIHISHPYSTANSVFLCLNAPSSTQISQQQIFTSNAPDITSFIQCALYEQDLYNTHNTGQIWVGEKLMSNGSAKQISVSLPNAVLGSTISARLAFASPTASGRFDVALGSQNSSFTVTNREKHNIFEYTFAHAQRELNFTISFASSANSTTGYLDYIELTSPTQSLVQGESLIHTDCQLGAGRYAQHSIQYTRDNQQIWDVTNSGDIKEMRIIAENGNLIFINEVDKPHDYIVFTPGSGMTPAHIAPLENQNIHGSDNPDMVIVCNSNLYGQAEQIADLHRLYDGMNVLVVTQNQVFNEFSSGKKDPIAIREMMRMFWSRYQDDNSLTKPKYLLLFGKGTYDNKNIQNYNYTTVVTYQSPISFTDDCGASPSDDVFALLDNNEAGINGPGFDISVGRLPAKNVDEADRLVSKIEKYMLHEDFSDPSIRGDWRTFVALLADDADPSQSGDIDFAQSQEYLSNYINQRHPWINLDKIYADAYQQQSGTIGSYYPDVNNALKQRLDYGCLLLNYIGHGSDQYIGTERYMEYTDIDNYGNRNRSTFFVTSTCSFGKFDKLEGVSGSEAFVLAPNAGIGCIAAARPISHIKAFNTAVCLNALNGQYRIGDALRLAKNSHAQIQNCAIALMGDPALKLSFPQYDVVVTKINGAPVQENHVDSAEVLSKVTVEGEIRNSNGTVINNFNGLIFPLVFDRVTQNRTLANDNPGTEIDFTQQKNILYKGRDSVINGHFKYTFIVPRDVAYQYACAKLSHYAKDVTTQRDAAGAYHNLALGGFDENANISETRPTIRLYMGDTNFRNGGIVNENATLYAVLFDTIGINAVGSGLGHDITAVMDDNYNDLVVLNDFYETDITDGNIGYVTYQYEKLTPGKHSLTLKAWNIFNYSSEASIDFYVRSNDSVSLGRLIAYPNPSSSFVQLSVEQNSPASFASAEVDIYDMRGGKVRTIALPVHQGSYVAGPITWDFSTNRGNIIPDGVYMARVRLTTNEGEVLTSATRIIKSH